MRIALALTLALGVVACAPTATTETPSGGEQAQACPAAKYTPFIGRNRTELPAAASNETRRVVCTTCPVTMDYRTDRTTITYDDATGIVREVKCG